jgi:hypothetical protein
MNEGRRKLALLITSSGLKTVHLGENISLIAVTRKRHAVMHEITEMH